VAVGRATKSKRNAVAAKPLSNSKLFPQLAGSKRGANKPVFDSKVKPHYFPKQPLVPNTKKD